MSAYHQWQFDVKPRMKDIYWAFWHPLKLTIHEPIEPIGKELTISRTR